MLATPAAGLPDRQRRADRSPPAARARWTRPSPTSCARARRRSPAPPASSASAGSSSARPTAPTSSSTSRAGASASTRGVRPPARRERRHRGRLRDARGDLDRHRPRHPGDRRGRARAGRAARRRRRLRPRRRRAQAGRVGRRRRRRRLAEGADDPARPRVRVGLAARARRRRRQAPGGRYYFDWVKTAKQQRKDPPNSPFTPAGDALPAALDVSLGMIEEEGLENVCARHALLARATRAGAAGARPRPLRRPGRALDRRHRDRAARRDRRQQGPRRSCASSASPPTAARTS